MDDHDHEPTDSGENDSGLRADLVVGVLNAVAIFLAVAWVWTVLRGQQNTGHYSFSSDGEPGDVTFAQRIDIAVSSMTLIAYAAVVAGVAQIVTLLTRRHGQNLG
jgi:hypothetical protein